MSRSHESERKEGGHNGIVWPPLRFVQAESKSALRSDQYESELMTSPPVIVESDCQTPLPDAENGKQGAVALLPLRVMLGGL